MGRFKEGNAANAVGKAFSTFRTADRIHKTCSVMLKYLFLVDQYYPRKDGVQRNLVY